MNEQVTTNDSSTDGEASALSAGLAADSKRALELLGSIFYCGHFVAETRNEQELEMLMRKHGYFIETEAHFDAYCRTVHEAANAAVSRPRAEASETLTPAPRSA